MVFHKLPMATLGQSDNGDNKAGFRLIPKIQVVAAVIVVVVVVVVSVAPAIQLSPSSQELYITACARTFVTVHPSCLYGCSNTSAFSFGCTLKTSAP